MDHAYAQALWKKIASGTSPRDAVSALKKALAERGRQALLPKVARAFERVAERELSRERVVVSVAREKDARAAEKEARAFLAPEGIEDAAIEASIDDSLIGGWRMEGRGLLVDRSWKRSLLSMYNRAIH